MQSSYMQNLHETQDLHIQAFFILIDFNGGKCECEFGTGSLFYYSLYGETTTEAAAPIIMRESSILSKA